MNRKPRPVPEGLITALHTAGFHESPDYSTRERRVYLRPRDLVRVECSGPTTAGVDKVTLRIISMRSPSAGAPVVIQPQAFVDTDFAIAKVRSL